MESRDVDTRRFLVNLRFEGAWPGRPDADGRRHVIMMNQWFAASLPMAGVAAKTTDGLCGALLSFMAEWNFIEGERDWSKTPPEALKDAWADCAFRMARKRDLEGEADPAWGSGKPILSSTLGPDGEMGLLWDGMYRTAAAGKGLSGSASTAESATVLLTNQRDIPVVVGGDVRFITSATIVFSAGWTRHEEPTVRAKGVQWDAPAGHGMGPARLVLSGSKDGDSEEFWLKCLGEDPSAEEPEEGELERKVAANCFMTELSLPKEAFDGTIMMSQEQLAALRMEAAAARGAGREWMLYDWNEETGEVEFAVWLR